MVSDALRLLPLIIPEFASIGGSARILILNSANRETCAPGFRGAFYLSESRLSDVGAGIRKRESRRKSYQRKEFLPVLHVHPPKLNEVAAFDHADQVEVA